MKNILQLLSLISEKKWGQALKYINSKSKWMSNKIRNRQQDLVAAVGIRTKDCDNYNDGAILLTSAILHGAPIKVIEVILDQVGYSTIACGPFGLTPLHAACACGSSYDIVRALTTCHHNQRSNETIGVHDAVVIAAKLDKCKRTPLHHLLHYICYPKDVDTFRAMFENTSRVMQIGGSLDSSTSSCSSTDDHSSKASSPSKNLSITQEHLEDLLMTIQHLVQIGPKAIFCQDIDRRYPIDILQDCKAMCNPINKGPQWERADITCLTLRKLMIKYYCSEKRIAERKGFLDTAAVRRKSSASVGTSSTMDNSSVMSGSILSGLSKLEVDSLSIGHLTLSVCNKS